MVEKYTWRWMLLVHSPKNGYSFKTDIPDDDVSKNLSSANRKSRPFVVILQCCIVPPRTPLYDYIVVSRLQRLPSMAMTLSFIFVCAELKPEAETLTIIDVRFGAVLTFILCHKVEQSCEQDSATSLE